MLWAISNGRSTKKDLEALKDCVSGKTNEEVLGFDSKRFRNVPSV